ncbi:hypothetical protein Tco_1424172, partial [Tanacetum coccineum]
PTDIDDNDDEEEESSRDDADDEEEDEDKEEEEHLALADSVPPLAYRTIARMPSSPLTSYSSPLPQIPSPSLPVSSPLPMSPPPLLASPTHPLGYRAAMIRLRAESPSTSHPLPLPPLPPPIVLPHTRASMAMMRADAPSTYILASRSEIPPSERMYPEVTLSPQKRLCSPQKRLCIDLGPRYEIEESSSSLTARPTGGFRVDYGFVGTLDTEIRHDPDREIELGKRMTNFVTTVRQDTDEIYRRLDDAHDDRSLISGQLNLLRRDRRTHARTARLIESEARASREAWTQMAALQSQQTPARNPAHLDVPEEAGSIIFSYDLKKMAPTKRTTRESPATTTTTTPVTNAQLKSLIDQDVVDALAARDADRSQNGIDNHNSGTGSRRTERTARECSYTDFLKGVSFDVREVFPEESDNIEKYVGGLLDMIHGSVIASKPKIMQDAVEFATELMDKKIHTFAERQVKNKRKFEETSGNNQNQQQQNKRQNTGMAYTVRSGEKKPYEGSKPMCSKYNYHHDGQCAPKCHKCNRVGHLARD